MPGQRRKTVPTSKDVDRLINGPQTMPTEEDIRRAELNRRRAINRAVKEITALFVGLEDMTPVERMAAYLAAGRLLRRVLEDELTYGPSGVTDITTRVPHLLTPMRAYQVLGLADRGDAVCAALLEETATPMDDGRPLGPGHWAWVFRACSQDAPAGDDERFRAELAWLRRESPSEAVLEHIAQVLDRERERELDEIREAVVSAAEGVRGAVGCW